MKFLTWILFLPFMLAAFDPTPVTPYPVVGFIEAPFTDSDKVNRTLNLWYPVNPTTTGTTSSSPWDLFHLALNAPVASSNSKKPVVVLSHGYTGSPHQLSWLIRSLVYHDFIVVAVQHRDLLDGEVHMNHWKRAQDIQAIISTLPAVAIADSMDLNKIGVAGYSLGGTTAIWVSGGRSNKLDTLIPGPEYSAVTDYIFADRALPSLNKQRMAADWRDSRVKAAFIMAPGWAWLFDEESLRDVHIPTYIIAADEDRVLVTKNNAGFFARLIPNALYQTIPGKADHFVFVSSLSESARRKANPSHQFDFLFYNDSSIDRDWIQFQVGEEAANFFNSIFRQP